jgi:hypothetical protein
LVLSDDTASAIRGAQAATTENKEEDATEKS